MILKPTRVFMQQTNKEITEIKVDEIDFDQFFPNAEDVLIPAEDTKKPSVFKDPKEDLDFLDEDEKSKEGKEPVNVNIEEILDSTLDIPSDELEEEKKAGRPKTEKSSLTNFLKKRIESGEMFAFEDYDESQPLDEYLSNLSEKEMEDLWQVNMDHIKEEITTRTPQEFIESLPEKLQFAAKYVMDGGEDLEGLFLALAQVEHTTNLNPDNDAETIAIRYLQATDFGTPEDIEEVISEWRENGTLEKRSASFQKKLQEIESKEIQDRMERQAQIKQKQQEAAEAYLKNVFEALKPGELGGIKINKKTQETLYKGLVKPEYKSLHGTPTNLLGHLLEKYQFVEPNHALIAEALWLLQDPESYRSEIRKLEANIQTEKTVKKLKTEQAGGKTQSSASIPDNNDTIKKSGIKKLERPNNFLKR